MERKTLKQEKEQDEALVREALLGLSRSYAPYSHFHVSAALLCGDGSIYTGNNIENAAYSATVCAERCAFFKAVSEGKREFAAIAICGGKDGEAEDYCPPCGVCRQVMREFCGPSFRRALGRTIWGERGGHGKSAEDGRAFRRPV